MHRLHLKRFGLVLTAAMLGLAAAPAATFSVDVGIQAVTGDVNGTHVFLSSATVSDLPLSISDNETVVLPQFQSYQFTDIGNFGHQTFSAGRSRTLWVNGEARGADYSLSLSLQPGWINFSQTATAQWDLDFSGDRKTFSVFIGSTGGSGTHTGYFPGNFSLAEVFDDPMAVIGTMAAEVTLGDGMILDGLNSFDLDSTGAIANWDWDLNYDGISFDADLSGSSVSPEASLMQSLYLDGETYSVGLRVTDDTGAQSVSSASFVYSSVPEPGTVLFLAFGSTLLLARRRQAVA